MRPLTSLLKLLACAATLSLHAQSAYLVKDLNVIADAETSSSNPTDFFQHGGRIFFAASASPAGRELWLLNSNQSGATLVSDINPGAPGSFPSQFASVNGRLLFNATDARGQELWASDGTAAGTRIVTDIHPTAS